MRRYYNKLYKNIQQVGCVDLFQTHKAQMALKDGKLFAMIFTGLL